MHIMITTSNYIWFIKAMHLTVLLLMATGIFIRWRSEVKSRRVLALMFVSLAVFYTVDLVLSQFYTLRPFMLQQGKGLAYSFGALYNGMVLATFTYLYTRAVFKPEKLTVRLFVRTNMLTVVSLSVYIILIVLGFRPVAGYDSDDLRAQIGNNPFVPLWIMTVIAFYVYIAYISFIVLRWMVIHMRNIKNNFSSVNDFRYYYVYITYMLFGMTMPLGIVTLLLNSDETSTHIISGIVFLVILLLIYVFSYFQKDIYSEEQPMEDIETSLFEPNVDEKQLIRFNDRRLIEKLRVLIEEERIYTRPDLSAETLAERMEISRKKLYLFLKEYYGSVFSDYINGCRLAHAEMLMKDKRSHSLTILEISEMSGFNSVGTFNKFFKAKHLTTPAKYRSNMEN